MCERKTVKALREKLEIIAYLLQQHERHQNAYTLYNKQRRGSWRGTEYFLLVPKEKKNRAQNEERE